MANKPVHSSVPCDVYDQDQKSGFHIFAALKTVWHTIDILEHYQPRICTYSTYMLV